jgi:hypothetical protein
MPREHHFDRKNHKSQGLCNIKSLIREIYWMEFFQGTQGVSNYTPCSEIKRGHGIDGLDFFTK